MHSFLHRDCTTLCRFCKECHIIWNLLLDKADVRGFWTSKVMLNLVCICMFTHTHTRTWYFKSCVSGVLYSSSSRELLPVGWSSFVPWERESHRAILEECSGLWVGACVNSFISSNFCQFIDFISVISIHSFQFLHFNSFKGNHWFQIIHINSFNSIPHFNSLILIPLFQFINFNSFSSIPSFQFSHFDSSV